MGGGGGEMGQNIDALAVQLPGEKVPGANICSAAVYDL